VCCSVLQCVAVCCSVLQCVASMLQCVAVCCSGLQCIAVCCKCVAVCCSVLQCLPPFQWPVAPHSWLRFEPSLCVMTHSYMWHGSFYLHINKERKERKERMSHTCSPCVSAIWSLLVWHNSFTCVTWLIYMCNMTHSYVWLDSFVF